MIVAIFSVRVLFTKLLQTKIDTFGVLSIFSVAQALGFILALIMYNVAALMDSVFRVTLTLVAFVLTIMIYNGII